LRAGLLILNFALVLKPTSKIMNLDFKIYETGKQHQRYLKASFRH